MKRFLIIFCFLLSFTAFAQESDVVTANGNVRTEATEDNFLTKIHSQVQEWTDSATSFVEGSNWQVPLTVSRKTFVIILFVISVIMCILRRFSESRGLEGWKFLFLYITFIVLALLELLYLIMVEGDSIWFCKPDDVGWLMVVINFILFAWFVYNQIMTFIDLLDGCDDIYDAYVDLRVGIYSWIIGAIAIVVFAIFWNDYVIYVGVALLIAQFIQLIIIIVSCIRGRGFLYSIPYMFLYIVGTVATLAVLVNFIVLLLIVLVGYFVLMIFGSGSTRNEKVDVIVTLRNGDKINLYKRGPNEYVDDDGYDWWDDGSGSFTRE